MSSRSRTSPVATPAGMRRSRATRTTWGTCSSTSRTPKSLAESGSTYLSYGIFWPAHISEEEYKALSSSQREELYDATTIKLMKTVVIPILQEHGIGVSWEGNVDTRILLTDVEWYAPLPPVEEG